MFKNSSLNRRHFVLLALSGLVGAVAVRAKEQTYSTQLVQTLDNPKRNFTVVNQAPLKQLAAAKGLIYGAAATQYDLSPDIKFAASFAQQCGILVPNLELKWDALRPTPSKFNFKRADWLAEFARSHNIPFRGHTLVWELALPKWFKEKVNRQNAEKFLIQHINTVTKRYAGKMHSWDVVNEAIAYHRSHRSDGLSINPWLSFLGKNYIDLAFRVAAEADPKAMLVYNDRWLDYDTFRDSGQRVAVLKLLEHLKTIKTPVHALGIQAHLYGAETRFNPRQFRNFLKDVASLGLKILITELDVKDYGLPSNPAIRDRIIAAAYEDYLSVVLDEKAVIAVITWGLSDRYTWLSTYAPRPDGLPVRPLPLDSNLKPKLAWYAIARAFDHAPRR
ncbi:MAG: endo-1,4-beta-xylanase [Scytonema sp. PMC 1069.18]|nr:endo-1,4-beta-xylanase [Scytonema sp. PMC 1069.18]MEC4882338.1 endo-1,4-beta-xylanase [Scytonema sp. PMC 1070.18]